MQRAGFLLPAIAAALLAIAGAAQAQQAGGGAVLREAADDDMMVQPFNKTVEELEEADLVDHAGAEIGEVEQVLVGEDGQPAAITAEVGGFLGVGQKTVVIGLDRPLQLKDDALMTALTKEELGAMRTWGNP
jgi:hypothetical protein